MQSESNQLSFDDLQKQRKNQKISGVIEAEKVIDTFTSSVIDAMGQGKEISLLGFGNFTVSKIAARNGRNPRTGTALKIAAYNQPKFKVGSKLKEACNK